MAEQGHSSGGEGASGGWGERFQQQTIIALLLIGVFGAILFAAIVKFSSTEVISIAGIFSSWITAIVAVIFVERGAQTAVKAAREGTTEIVRAKDVEGAGSLVQLDAKWTRVVQQLTQEWTRTREDLQAQLDRALRAVPPSADASLGEVVG